MELRYLATPGIETHEADGILDFTERAIFPHKDDFVISAVPETIVICLFGFIRGKNVSSIYKYHL